MLDSHRTLNSLAVHFHHIWFCIVACSHSTQYSSSFWTLCLLYPISWPIIGDIMETSIHIATAAWSSFNNIPFNFIVATASQLFITAMFKLWEMGNIWKIQEDRMFSPFSVQRVSLMREKSVNLRKRWRQTKIMIQFELGTQCTLSHLTAKVLYFHWVITTT